MVNVSKSGLAASFTVAFHESTGLLSIALSDDVAINGSGDLLTIQLEMQSNAPLGGSPLTLASASLNNLFGRDFVKGFANNKLIRQSGTLSVTSASNTNQQPSAGNDSATTTQGGAVTINVKANDSDPDGDALTVTTRASPATARPR